MGVHQDQYRGFAQYNREFNQRLFDQVSLLSDDERKKDMGAFFGSIHRTLNHILLADRVWLGRFASAVPDFRSLDGAALIREFSSLSQELCSDFEELRAERKATDDVLTNWVEELTDKMLSVTMRYSNSSGKVREHPVWLAAAHLFNHQTHHRGQVTTLLNQLGHDPGVTDYIALVQYPGKFSLP